MAQDVQEELEKIRRQVWRYLEGGEWLGAMLAAGQLNLLDPDNQESRALTANVHKINEIADEVKGGNKKGAAARLEDIARALPKLAELDSFKSLLGSVRNSGRKKGIFISIVVAFLVVMVFNLAGYEYIRVETIATEAQRTSMEAWQGIKDLNRPVDILLLGDSACRVDLAPGAIADRLGGDVINLGTTTETSFLSDAWMLSKYIEKFGVPKAVVVLRTSGGYVTSHDIEFLANIPLPWGFWNTYGLAPKWKKGETLQLLLQRYAVLYSDADVFQERLPKIWTLFDYNIVPRVPSHSYTAGITQSKELMDVSTHTPSFYFSGFHPSADTTDSIKYMVNLAQKYHFQLYFTLQCEWNEAVNAGLRDAHLAAQKTYLSQFVDDQNVFMVEQSPKTLFTKAQMQNPNHLWHGAEKIYTEEIVNAITEIQNNLTEKQAEPLGLDSVSLDKDSYQAGDQPIITLSVNDPGNHEPGGLTGSVSCLVKPSGDINGHWLARATAVNITLNGDDVKQVVLQLTAGKLEAGTFDLVVFLRQDVSNLSHETRIEIPKKILVK